VADLQSFKQDVQSLVRKFEQDKNHYLQKGYPDAQVGIDFNNPSERAIHDKLVSLVDRMLDLHKKKAALPASAEREKIEREIAVTDEKIDEIVSGLYGITDDEKSCSLIRDARCVTMSNGNGSVFLGLLYSCRNLLPGK
jgi:hypothetical protein